MLESACNFAHRKGQDEYQARPASLVAIDYCARLTEDSIVVAAVHEPVYLRVDTNEVSTIWHAKEFWRHRAERDA
jgi:hypothetical protein